MLVGCEAVVCDVVLYADMMCRVLYCIPGRCCSAIICLI